MSRGVAASLCALLMFVGAVQRIVVEGKNAAADLAIAFPILIVALDDILGG